MGHSWAEQRNRNLRRRTRGLQRSAPVPLSGTCGVSARMFATWKRSEDGGTPLIANRHVLLRSQRASRRQKFLELAAGHNEDGALSYLERKPPVQDGAYHGWRISMRRRLLIALFLSLAAPSAALARQDQTLVSQALTATNQQDLISGDREQASNPDVRQRVSFSKKHQRLLSRDPKEIIPDICIGC